MMSMAGAQVGTQAGGGGPVVRFRLKPDRRLASVVELAAGALAGEGVAAIGRRLGLDRTAAAAAAAPALLLVAGRLSSKAREGETEPIAEALRHVSGRWPLDGLPASLLDLRSTTTGPRVLDHVFGDDLAEAAAAVTRASELPPTQSVALLGMLTLVTLGVLDRVSRQQWLEPDGVAHLLVHQRFHAVPVAELAASLLGPLPEGHPPIEALQVLVEDLQRGPF